MITVNNHTFHYLKDPEDSLYKVFRDTTLIGPSVNLPTFNLKANTLEIYGTNVQCQFKIVIPKSNLLSIESIEAIEPIRNYLPPIELPNDFI